MLVSISYSGDNKTDWLALGVVGVPFLLMLPLMLPRPFSF